MWEKGLSTTQISRRLNVTRNVVAGRIYRLRKSGNEKAHERAPPRTIPPPPVEKLKIRNRSIVRKINKGEILRADVEKQMNRQWVRRTTEVSIMNLKPHHCRYIVIKQFGYTTLYCGRDKASGSYCEDHARLCYAPRAIKTNIES